MINLENSAINKVCIEVVTPQIQPRKICLSLDSGKSKVVAEYSGLTVTGGRPPKPPWVKEEPGTKEILLDKWQEFVGFLLEASKKFPEDTEACKYKPAIKTSLTLEYIDKLSNTDIMSTSTIKNCIFSDWKCQEAKDFNRLLDKAGELYGIQHFTSIPRFG
ncbi:hypothetical protein KKG41_04250 [Patescibacteria group bacterium]|nr:hypothetical protein [Patescibacteria group bacterium]MBU1890979.1 hypothetical protein [Patescibacteria group bacterium]